uniref:receptor protein serine/threonine kinase n=1 Tax=Neogobius melanostomus TaxID=47308 RepID=A0A8C6TPJ2_9GOBI
GTRSEVRECAFSDHLQPRRAGSPRSANLLRGEQRDNGTVRCSHGLACFGLWEQRPGGEVLLLKQGESCWTPQPDCLSDLCLVTAPPAHIHKGSYRFCCCSGDLCNAHFREAPPTAAPPVHRLPGEAQTAHSTPQMSLLLRAYIRLSKIKNIPDWPRALCKCVPRNLSDRMVAVKVFSSAQRQKYTNQRAIYRSLPTVTLFKHLDQASALTMFKSRLKSMYNSCTLFSLVHVFWMCFSLCDCKALALPGPLAVISDQSKPAVVHRDVSSTNVLVRSDLSCVLSGFSLSMSLSRDPSAGHGDPGSVAISEAGALRYRAPELLSGALDLREYGTALKQVDVYALGLLFWESFRRCHDLFPLGFESELGPEPSLEDMHELVAREKFRPHFPSEWKHNSPVLRLLKETMEDCWDQDAEARLSAQCAEERLSQLSLLTVPAALTPR